MYQIILDKWLDGEVRRRRAPGGLKTLEKNHLWAAVTRLALRMPEGGWAVVLPDGRYKLAGNPAGRFWWTVGLCRFEPGELDPYVSSIRALPLDAPIFPP